MLLCYACYIPFGIAAAVLTELRDSGISSELFIWGGLGLLVAIFVFLPWLYVTVLEWFGFKIPETISANTEQDRGGSGK